MIRNESRREPSELQVKHCTYRKNNMAGALTSTQKEKSVLFLDGEETTPGFYANKQRSSRQARYNDAGMSRESCWRMSRRRERE